MTVHAGKTQISRGISEHMPFCWFCHEAAQFLLISLYYNEMKKEFGVNGSHGLAMYSVFFLFLFFFLVVCVCVFLVGVGGGGLINVLSKYAIPNNLDFPYEHLK